MKSDTFLKEARGFERTLRIWPWIRLLLRRYLSRRCCRCVLSERHGPLDDAGLCAACLAFRPSLAPRPDISTAANPFAETMAQSAGKASGRYDALVLISGGKDSAYLLHRLRQDHPQLRLLTLLVNNGFMSPVALENVADLRRQFPVEHIELQPSPAIVWPIFHWALTHLHRQKGYSLVDLFDAQITFDSAMNLAAAMGIPHVIAGLSKTQVESVFSPGVWAWPRDGFDLPATVGVRREEAHADQQQSLWYRAERWPEARRPLLLTPFVLWDPSESYILAETTRLGLLPQGRSSPLLTNNALIPIIGLAEVAHFGYSSFEVQFAREVREGKSDRARWISVFEMLEFAAKTGRFLNRSVTETLSKLGLTPHHIGI